MAQAADLLAGKTAERHRTVVLIVDEAHLQRGNQHDAWAADDCL